jgi:hypothetical protein
MPCDHVWPPPTHPRRHTPLGPTPPPPPLPGLVQEDDTPLVPTIPDEQLFQGSVEVLCKGKEQYTQSWERRFMVVWCNPPCIALFHSEMAAKSHPDFYIWLPPGSEWHGKRATCLGRGVRVCCGVVGGGGGSRSPHLELCGVDPRPVFRSRLRLCAPCAVLGQQRTRGSRLHLRARASVWRRRWGSRCPMHGRVHTSFMCKAVSSGHPVYRPLWACAGR